jgi:hypothetical protein
MPDTTNRSKRDAVKQRLEDVAKRIPPEVAPEMSQAIRDFVTAANYPDRTLINSSLNSVFEALSKLVRDIIQAELKISEDIKEHVREVWREHIDGVPLDSFEEIRKAIESLIDERIAKMTGLRDEPVRLLEEREHHVENAQQLEDGIRDLRRFRENIFKDWPRPGKRPVLIDRQAVDEAKAAIARGEKGMRREELVHPQKGLRQD